MPIRHAPTNRAEALSLPSVLRFMQLLWAVVHGVESASKRMTAHIGVTGPQRLVLRVVGLFPGLSAGGLSSALHLHPSTLTGVLQRLVAQGLLERVPHATDRRRAVLRLTATGGRINAVRGGTVEAAVARALRDVERGDRAATVRVLARLADCLEPPAARPTAATGTSTRRRRAERKPAYGAGRNTRRGSASG